MQGKIAGTAGLVGAWTFVAAWEAQWIHLRLPGDLDRVVVVGLGAVTTALMIAHLLRGPSYYAALRLGRRIEREDQRRQASLQIDDGPTVGTGIGR